MADITEIYNRALTKLGAARVTSPTEQSTPARACNSCYDALRRLELSLNPWNFSIQRFQLATSSTDPLFGPYKAYPLPTGWLRVLPPDPTSNVNDRDWTIEGQSIMTSFDSPLNVRCVMDIEEVPLFSASFIEALACKMAWEMCEQLTQSNTKKQDCKDQYKAAISEARKQNAIQKVPQQIVEDSWITVRASGSSVGAGWGPGWGLGG